MGKFGFWIFNPALSKMVNLRDFASVMCVSVGEPPLSGNSGGVPNYHAGSLPPAPSSPYGVGATLTVNSVLPIVDMGKQVGRIDKSWHAVTIVDRFLGESLNPGFEPYQGGVLSDSRDNLYVHSGVRLILGEVYD